MDNAYSTFADGLFRHTIGVPTGTNCAPEIANIFLFYYELEFFQQKLSAWNVLSKPMFKSGGISTIFFSAMFGETAKWTGIFSTVVEKNEWLNHWKNTRT